MHLRLRNPPPEVSEEEHYELPVFTRSHSEVELSNWEDSLAAMPMRERPGFEPGLGPVGLNLGFGRGVTPSKQGTAHRGSAPWHAFPSRPRVTD
jgi:hypothetical protein